MAQQQIPLKDRQAIYDTLARYVWNMDTRNVDGVIETFTADGVVQDATGKVWDDSSGGPRGFATHYLGLPDRPLSQHWIQHMLIETASESGYCVTSYWGLVALDEQTNNKCIRSFGRYRDTCLQVNGQWLIQNKIIDPWNRNTMDQITH